MQTLEQNIPIDELTVPPYQAVLCDVCHAQIAEYNLLLNNAGTVTVCSECAGEQISLATECKIHWQISHRPYHPAPNENNP